jgi:hypothetical protein
MPDESNALNEAGYDPLGRGVKVPRRTETAESARAALDADRDLTTGQIALILAVSRFAVDHWLVEGIADRATGERWTPEHHFTPGGHRKVPAGEVRKLIALTARQPRARRIRHEPPPSSQ